MKTLKEFMNENKVVVGKPSTIRVFDRGVHKGGTAIRVNVKKMDSQNVTFEYNGATYTLTSDAFKARANNTSQVVGGGMNPKINFSKDKSIKSVK